MNKPENQEASDARYNELLALKFAGTLSENQESELRAESLIQTEQRIRAEKLLKSH